MIDWKRKKSCIVDKTGRVVALVNRREDLDLILSAVMLQDGLSYAECEQQVINRWREKQCGKCATCQARAARNLHETKRD